MRHYSSTFFFFFFSSFLKQTLAKRIISFVRIYFSINNFKRVLKLNSTRRGNVIHLSSNGFGQDSLHGVLCDEVEVLCTRIRWNLEPVIDGSNLIYTP